MTEELITWEIEASDISSAWKTGEELAMMDRYANEASLHVRLLEEDKQAICDKLLEAPQLTSNLYVLIYLKYLPDKEQVVAHFPEGDKTVNVAMDSGTAMIKNIIKGIV